MQQSHVQDDCDRIGERQKKLINNMAKTSEKGTDAPLEKIRARAGSISPECLVTEMCVCV